MFYTNTRSLVNPKNSVSTSAELGWQDQLEAGAALLGVIDEVSPMRAGVRAGDRETEPGPLPPGAVRATRELLEEAPPNVFGYACAGIEDIHADMPVDAGGRNDDRWLAVPERVRHEVGENPVERERVGVDRRA
jgi:hypothetical protein